MSSFAKNVLITAGVIAGGFYATSGLIDSLSPNSSPSSESVASDTSTEDAKLEQQLRQLMAGADPSDLFEPTAAGGAKNCLHGRIEMPEDKQTKLQGRLYVAHRVNDRTYIQTLPENDTYLVQSPLQAVTADQQVTIPASAEKALRQEMQRPDDCIQRDLYLDSINNPAR